MLNSREIGAIQDFAQTVEGKAQELGIPVSSLARELKLSNFAKMRRGQTRPSIESLALALERGIIYVQDTSGLNKPMHVRSLWNATEKRNRT